MSDFDTVLHQHLKEMTLLCVDDSITIQSIYKSVYTVVFKEVFIASDGQEALETINKHAIDIIISDYQMPRMDGLEMIKKLHSDHRMIPIIFVTAEEDKNIVVEALNLGVEHFIYKPFDMGELSDSVEKAAKTVLANQLLAQEQQDLEKLKEQKAYQEYQEELSFRKELTILRDDFYYQRVSGKRELLIDLLYMPLDTLSGDAYSTRAISEDQILFLIVDGMGKGLSASQTAMLFVAFVNYEIDRCQEKCDRFEFTTILERSIAFIQKLLLEEEVLSAEFILLNKDTQTLEYAIYSMPELLLLDSEGVIQTIASNNAPINKYFTQTNIGHYALQSIQKLLFSSDGLVENAIKEGGTYTQKIKEDFLNSMTRHSFKKKAFSHIIEQEDDITFILLSFLEPEEFGQKMRFSVEMESLNRAQNWYEALLEKESMPEKTLHNALLTFYELFMNAFEHGSLGIDSNHKEALIKNDAYETYLEDACQTVDKQIEVYVRKMRYREHESYLLTQISDQGEGFDTQILSQIFRNRNQYNGKGVYLSRNISDGIYFNQAGNSVMFIMQITHQ